MDRIIKAFGYSWAGLVSCFKTEAAFRQEIYLAAIAFPVVYILNTSATNKALMVGSIFLIFIAELATTAIEVVIDRISEEKHPLSKKAKDIGSAIVLLAFVNAICIWITILAI